MGVETDADIEAFASDVIRSGRWHFTDPESPGTRSHDTQYLVASSLGRQVLLAKKYGINPIFYDFNNPLGNFRTHNDPVYRCLANLSTVTWIKYALNDQVSKATRDAAIMRERFSHDDEMAAYIEREMVADTKGKLVVIAGYAHTVMPGGLAERLEARLGRPAMITAVFKDEHENRSFHDFLWQQATLIQINLTRAPHAHFVIDNGIMRQEERPGRFAAIDGTALRNMPALCFQWAQLN
ncbi:MAG: hypothetical protein HOP09_16655 [Hyphomicrobium sp.]|nr:hypothetical protein [Hyphomicrobium sp.]